MDVLDVNIFGQVRDLFRVELVPDETGRGQIQSNAWTFDLMTTKAPSNGSILQYVVSEIHLDKKDQSMQICAFMQMHLEEKLHVRPCDNVNVIWFSFIATNSFLN